MRTKTGQLGVGRRGHDSDRRYDRPVSRAAAAHRPQLERSRSGVQESVDVIDHALGLIQEEQMAATPNDAELRGGH